MNANVRKPMAPNASTRGDKGAAPQDQPSFWQRHALKILFGALVILALYDVFGTHGVLAMYRTRQQLQQLQSQLDKINEQNKQLTNQINALKSDPQEIERIAREQMGLAKPGEKVFKLPPPAAGGNADGTTNAH